MCCMQLCMMGAGHSIAVAMALLSQTILTEVRAHANFYSSTAGELKGIRVTKLIYRPPQGFHANFQHAVFIPPLKVPRWPIITISVCSPPGKILGSDIYFPP